MPPLNWLRAFEAASRHMSFKNAAEELNVTPAAISQQMRQLEDYYEVRLFDRSPRALEFTRVGMLAAPLLTAAMNNMVSACDAMKNHGKKDVLVVTAPPSFSMKWLIPRLDDFRESHPDIEIRIDARDEVTNFKDGWADVGIRYGPGNYADVHVEPLIEDVYFPVCSPKLVEPHGNLLRLDDLQRHRLLHVDWPALAATAPSWEMWLQAARIEHPDADEGHRFTNEMMALDAAISGVGVALVSSAIADIDIRAGRLTTPFADHATIRTGFRYHLVLPNDRKPSGDITLFCDWLRTECASRSYASAD